MYFQKVLVTKDSLPQLTNVELVYQSKTDKYTEGWARGGNVCFSRYYPGTPGIPWFPSEANTCFYQGPLTGVRLEPPRGVR